ncbi:MAG: helix-hairpin-helix domain-containing protein [Planctomycetia bacterium]|jgi:competence ComEA-like helix-hairpin-helix protein|nr:helix-hairpin-helix domain-containing protein [Planctomycetia bacterium]
MWVVVIDPVSDRSAHPLSPPPAASQFLLTGIVAISLLTLSAWLLLRQATLVDHDRPPPATVQFSLDINTAAVPELSQLPGIGPTMARRIIAYRQQHGPFPDVAAVGHVSGIGPVTLQQIRPYIRPIPPRDDRG